MHFSALFLRLQPIFKVLVSNVEIDTSCDVDWGNWFYYSVRIHDCQNLESCKDLFTATIFTESGKTKKLLLLSNCCSSFYQKLHNALFVLYTSIPETLENGGTSSCSFKNGAPGPEVPFHSNIIGNFIFYQDRLETKLLQLFEHPENAEWFSVNFVNIFEVNIVGEQKQT